MARTRDRDAVTGVGDDRLAPADAGDAVLERLAAAVRTRVRARHEAEMRLASFAFDERPASDRSSWNPLADEATVDWRYFVLRALGAVGDADTVRVLDALRGEGSPFEELMGVIDPAAGDRLAAGDRVGDLASAGLVGRDLESDRVTLMPLGEALLDLVAELERRTRASQR
jgi:hypothetical protein